MASGENGITRRRLVGGAAVAAAGATLSRPAWSRAKSHGAPKAPHGPHPGGRRVDVAVVGAGLAGLTAARELVRAGRSVIVLEADDHVGGRTQNRSLGNGKITELKGEYVGPTQGHVVALARDLGIGTFKTYNQGDNVLFLDGTLSRYPTTNPIPP